MRNSQSVTAVGCLCSLAFLVLGSLLAWAVFPSLAARLGWAKNSEPTPYAVLMALPLQAPVAFSPVPTAETSPTSNSSPTATVPVATATPAPPTPTPAPPPPCATLMCSLLRRLGDLTSLPDAKNATVYQYSSQDRTDLEHYWDYFNSDELFRARGFQIRTGYDGQKEYVILPRTEGPGYIPRIYFTHRQHNWNLKPGDNPNSPEATEWGFFQEVGNIRFYFDDETSPRIDMPVTDFFRGDVWPFMAPLVGHYGTANGGEISYLPMPFRGSVLVATTGLPMLFEIEAVKFNVDPGDFQSFTTNLSSQETEELEQVISQWGKLGEYPYLYRGGLASLVKDIEIPAFSSAEVSVPGPGVISSLKLYLASGLDENVTMKIYWDGEGEPSVEGPLRALFGTAEAMRRYRSLPLGITWYLDANEFYNYFPLPFNDQARIVFDNGKADAVPLKLAVLYRPTTRTERISRFHARFKVERLEARPDDGGNYVLADLSGSGRYVGCILNMHDFERGGFDPNWNLPFLESDVNIWVDGAYALPGTGIEGDFNAGYYYIYTDEPNRQWLFALSGNTWKLMWTRDEEDAASQYRFYLTDSVEFKNSLRVEVEHGSKGNNLTVTYSSTAFWYQDE